MKSTLRVAVPALLTVATAALPGRILEAQASRGPSGSLRNSSHIGFGYVLNIPNTYVGFSALGLTPGVLGGAGLYADVKFSTTSPGGDPYYLAGITPTQAELAYGDMLFQEQSSYLSVNLALVYALTPDFAVYGGAGYTREEHYREYFDDDRTRGNLGFYWVADAADTGDRVNFMGGVFFGITTRVLIQMGVEAQPVGATIGATLIFPL